MAKHHSPLLAIVGRMKRLFVQADQSVARLQKRTGLGCLNGCGRCCENPRVSATPAQMLPAALHLLENGLAEPILEKMDSGASNGKCVFYQPDPLVPGNGRCLHYTLRPLVCRLFGFSARKEKNGQTSFVTCAHLRAGRPAEVGTADGAVREGYRAPFMAHFEMRAYSIAPLHGHPLPINEALRKAIEMIGLSWHLQK